MPKNARNRLKYLASTALKQQEEGPCPGCPYKQECFEKKLACATFLTFVQKSETARVFRELAKHGRIPLREIYDLVFSPYDDVPTGETSKTGKTAYRAHDETIRRRKAAKKALEDAILRMRTRAIRKASNG